MNGHTRQDRIIKNIMREKVEVALIVEKTRILSQVVRAYVEKTRPYKHWFRRVR